MAFNVGDAGHVAEHNRQVEHGSLWLKANSDVTEVSEAGGRYLIAGTSEPAEGNRGFGFVQDGNVLQLSGHPGTFHLIATGSILSANNAVLGVYLAVSRDPAAELDPGAAGTVESDRLGQSEVYVTMPGTARPGTFAVQSIVDLEVGDRVYVIVQNRNGTADITVEFLHLAALAV